MFAGAGKSPIKLDGVLPFDGFDEARHPIYARALVVEAVERVCIVSLDATSISPRLMDALRSVVAEESGCSGAHVWLCVTHAFSSPHVRTPEHLASDAERAKNDVLLAAYAEAVRSATKEAVSALGPATLSVGSGAFSVNVNRDVETPGGWWIGSNPDGYSDHEVRALVVNRSGEDSSPVAVLFTADIQSSVLDKSRTSEGKRQVSGDLAGFVATRVEDTFPSATAIFIVGTAADQAPAERAVSVEVAPDGTVIETDAHEQGFRMLHQQGSRFTAELLDAIEAAEPVPCERVRAEQHPVTCPGQRRADFHTLAPHRQYAFEPSEPVSMTVSMLALGPVALVGVEPELSSAFGHRVRTEAPAAHVLLFTLVNGGAKYLPDDDAYEKVTYEAMNSGFARGSDEVLARDLLASIGQLMGDRPEKEEGHECRMCQKKDHPTGGRIPDRIPRPAEPAGAGDRHP